MVISAIYSSLIDAKLDTAAQRVEVSSAAGRDVSDDEIPGMIATLGNWARQCEEVLGDIDHQMAEIQRLAVEKRKERDEYDREVTAKRDFFGKKIGDGGEGRGAGSSQGGTGKGKRVISEGEEGVSGYEDLMDIDEESGTQGSQRGGGFFGLRGDSGRKRKGLKANRRR